jgi:polysaccharide pyruvyl transferase WcaK-like protein
MRFVITGVTWSGNMGGAAMLQTAIDELSARFPDAEFSLLSIAPVRDRQYGGLAKIVSARPLTLLLLYLPLAMLFWPLRWLPGVRWLLARLTYFRALYQADMVIDLCGIAFVDGRGLPLLAYNMACCLPALMMGAPVAKLSQALGPFRTQPNRATASFLLSRCRVLVARGDASLAHLRSLGLARAVQLPDVTFALTVRDEDRVRARMLLPGGEGPLLVTSPSEVVNRLCAAGGIDFTAQFATLLANRIAAGWRVLLVPHSLGQGNSKNNDVDLCRAVAARLPADRATLVKADEDPRLLRALIGQGDAFIGCRFHAVVAALAMGVPSLVIGWSHKYREMAEMLQPGDWFLDATQFSAVAAESIFARLWEQHAELRAGILQRLPDVRRQASSNFDLVAEALHRG